jgi:hypothetical protein
MMRGSLAYTPISLTGFPLQKRICKIDNIHIKSGVSYIEEHARLKHKNRSKGFEGLLRNLSNLKPTIYSER